MTATHHERRCACIYRHIGALSWGYKAGRRAASGAVPVLGCAAALGDSPL